MTAGGSLGGWFRAIVVGLSIAGTFFSGISFISYLIDRDVPSYFKSLEHLLRYCARPPFAIERLSVTRDPSRSIARVRYVLRRHKAAIQFGPSLLAVEPY